MSDEKRIKRFIEGAKEAFKEVDNPTFTFPMNILSAYELATSIEELLKEQKEQIKNRDESLEKAREEIKWLRGMLKEQEAVVRCIYCKRRGTYDCPVYVGGDGMNSEPDDWYCADGERRTVDV